MDRVSDFFGAVERRDLAAVRRLLDEEPALALASDATGATALHSAAIRHDPELAELLLRAGADVNARDHEYAGTPTGWAAHFWRERGGLLGIEIDDVLFAIERGEADWVGRLVTRHPALRAAKDRSGTPLAERAAASPDPEIRRHFLE